MKYKLVCFLTGFFILIFNVQAQDAISIYNFMPEGHNIQMPIQGEPGCFVLERIVELVDDPNNFGTKTPKILDVDPLILAADVINNCFIGSLCNFTSLVSFLPAPRPQDPNISPTNPTLCKPGYVCGGVVVSTNDGEKIDYGCVSKTKLDKNNQPCAYPKVVNERGICEQQGCPGGCPTGKKCSKRILQCASSGTACVPKEDTVTTYFCEDETANTLFEEIPVSTVEAKTCPAGSTSTGCTPIVTEPYFGNTVLPRGCPPGCPLDAQQADLQDPQKKSIRSVCVKESRVTGVIPVGADLQYYPPYYCKARTVSVPNSALCGPRKVLMGGRCVCQDPMAVGPQCLKSAFPRPPSSGGWMNCACPPGQRICTANIRPCSASGRCCNDPCYPNTPGCRPCRIRPIVLPIGGAGGSSGSTAGIGAPSCYGNRGPMGSLDPKALLNLGDNQESDLKQCNPETYPEHTQNMANESGYLIPYPSALPVVIAKPRGKDGYDKVSIQLAQSIKTGSAQPPLTEGMRNICAQNQSQTLYYASLDTGKENESAMASVDISKVGKDSYDMDYKQVLISNGCFNPNVTGLGSSVGGSSSSFRAGASAF